MTSVEKYKSKEEENNDDPTESGDITNEGFKARMKGEAVVPHDEVTQSSSLGRTRQPEETQVGPKSV